MSIQVPSRLRWPRPIAQQDLLALIKTLNDLLAAGVDLPWALSSAGQIIGNKTLQQSCTDQSQALLDGQPWPDILGGSVAPRWPAAFIAWVSVAVKTGALADSLACYANELTSAQQFRQTLSRQLSYPVAVLLIALGLSWFTGSQFGADTTALLALTLGVTVTALALCGFAVWLIGRTGGIREQRCWSHCARALGLCIDAGLSWPAALATLVDELQDLWKESSHIGHSLSECRESILQGQGIDVSAANAHFPETLQRSLQLASMTGDLGRALRQAADLLQIRQEQQLRRLTAMLPAAALALAAITLATQYALFIHPLYEQMGTLG